MTVTVTLVCVVQHVMQFSRSQQNALFFLRRSHLRQLADISKRRQQLLRQLQSAPEALGVSSGDLASSHFTVDDITQQLQKLLTDEHVAYMEYLRTVGHEVIHAAAAVYVSNAQYITPATKHIYIHTYIYIYVCVYIHGQLLQATHCMVSLCGTQRDALLFAGSIGSKYMTASALRPLSYSIY